MRVLPLLPAMLMALFTTAAGAAGIEHAMGTATVPDAPQRVIVLTNEGTEALLALGVKPVGAANSWNGDPWYAHIADQMEGVEPVGKESAVNLELIAALEPDLILGTKIRHEGIFEQLSAIAPTVVSERLRGDWRENFELWAKALNRQEAGEKVLEDFDAKVSSLKNDLDEAVDEKVSVIRFMPGHIRIYQKDSFSGFILDRVGFQRPENQDVDNFMLKAGKESIPDMDGDRIFYFTYEPGDGDATRLSEEVLADPLWQTLSAVKAGKVHQVDDTIWNTAGGVLAANLMLDDLARLYGLR
ncbi:iron-siderophore ABC transporter substrate-binding protein [Nitratireductor aquimarinus]|uniref:ABC transporter substrate-binding protein n=1 Tax=Nitratireductor aquimarinus TaxID=889300 RepID=UPI001A8E39F8|nr:iron-siderophore ABC transporter substrate-binding protein [Nitratireductor aquimarinus]MBN8241944.1 iron-siderophore ABC transporter substrate-binding protein [Nitratireductor aquimarinus]MBY6130330.1 iron-siderophore ABC transporter substrate-binding protein [Nitratireductor aquimarinus]MCA1302918.1 iron-siderophore ABC transporter substrate-binding protein [Nitratireductor aquimarinus]